MAAGVTYDPAMATGVPHGVGRGGVGLDVGEKVEHLQGDDGRTDDGPEQVLQGTLLPDVGLGEHEAR